jgi:protein-L-isoaspartate(D-aspartate) O-methyltransferase
MLEEDTGLVAMAGQTLASLAVDAAVVTGPLSAGLADQGPYDVILLNGSVPEVPRALLDPLADGGRLLAVVGQLPVCRAMQYVRRGDRIVSRVLFDAAVPPLPGFVAPRGFVF